MGRQASWPLDHSCLTAILVLAQSQRWTIAIISLHPLLKVSERKKCEKKRRESKDGAKKIERKVKEKRKERTFPANITPEQLLYFISCNVKADAGYAGRENTCFPAVLTSCSQSHCNSAATNHQRNSNSSELCLVPMGATFPWVCDRLAYIHEILSKAFWHPKVPFCRSYRTHAPAAFFFCAVKHSKSCFWRPILSH